MALADLDIFRPRLVERAVAETRNEIYSTIIPTPNSDYNSSIDFRVPGLDHFYTDLSPTLLELEVKITYVDDIPDNQKIKLEDNVGICNCVLASLFSSASVFINNTLVSPPSGCLPWVSHLQAMFEHGYETRQSLLAMAGYTNDTSANSTAGTANPNAQKQFQDFVLRGTAKLMAIIPVSLFQIRDLIVPLTEIVVRLHRNRPEFLIMYEQKTPPKQFNISVQRAHLHIRRI